MNKISNSSAGSDPTAHWQDHEHTSAQAQIEAQKLVDIAGSVELAKQAVAAATEPTISKNRDQFAQQLGFASFLEMFEASTVTSDASGGTWFITPLRAGELLVWNERDFEMVRRFRTSEEATAWIAESGI